MRTDGRNEANTLFAIVQRRLKVINCKTSVSLLWDILRILNANARFFAILQRRLKLINYNTPGSLLWDILRILNAKIFRLQLNVYVKLGYYGLVPGICYIKARAV
jgi:hypothetical protein